MELAARRDGELRFRLPEARSGASGSTALVGITRSGERGQNGLLQRQKN